MPGVISLDAIGTFEKDAVNIGTSGGNVLNAAGFPIAFPANTFLKATLSNQTAFMLLGKWSFGSTSWDPIRRWW